MNLRDLAKPDLCAMSASEIAERRRIEAWHGDDDGTAVFVLHALGPPGCYGDDTGLVTDDDHVTRLRGLGQRELNKLSEHRCETIADVRAAVASGEIPHWHQCGPVTEQVIRAALAKVDEAKRTTCTD